MRYYLAIDIGASNGRHILGHVRDGVMYIEEINRFDNSPVVRDGQLRWDIDALLGEILRGMKKCKEIDKLPVSVGIDTWGVDFALLGSDGRLLGSVAAYRDKRTNGMDDKIYGIIPEYELYQRTGIQKLIFNTIYQLMAVKTYTPGVLNEAEHLLLLPCYLHYLLCGVMKNEYTHATTSQLVNIDTGDWDHELISRCGYPAGIFDPIVPPGTKLGILTDRIKAEIGYDCAVVLPATHDTASAVMAVPVTAGDALYISSGTWSLMGVECEWPDCSAESMRGNFTNEGGYGGRYRYLKNIMGLWMIQCVSRELGGAHTYAELCDMAARESIPSIVDCNDQRFFAPDSMIDEIKKTCAETEQRLPQGAGEMAAVVYNSLVDYYHATIGDLERLTGKTYEQIHIIGGGAKAEYLNRLIAARTGRAVHAGPVEAAAIGNIMAQMITAGEFSGLAEARECVGRSFDIKIFNP